MFDSKSESSTLGGEGLGSGGMAFGLLWWIDEQGYLDEQFWQFLLETASHHRLCP